MQQDVALADGREQVAPAQGFGHMGLEDRKLQVGTLDQVDHLRQPAQVHRSGDPEAVGLMQIEFIEQALQDGGRAAGRDLQAHRIAVVPLAQLTLQRRPQVGDLLVVDEQLAVAGDTELMHRQDLEAREQRAHEPLDHRGQQHHAMRRARDLGGDPKHPGQRPGRLQHRDAGAPSEGILALELDDEIQALVQDPRERMGRIQRDRRQQGLDLGDEHRLRPRPLGIGPAGDHVKHNALGGQGRDQLFVEQRVLALDQLTHPQGDDLQAFARHHRIDMGGVGDLAQFGHADLEELVEVARDDGDVAQALEQRHLGQVGQRQDSLVEGQHALLAVEQAQDRFNRRRGGRRDSHAPQSARRR